MTLQPGFYRREATGHRNLRDRRTVVTAAAQRAQFGGASFWRTPLAPNAPLASTSADYSNRLAVQARACIAPGPNEDAAYHSKHPIDPWYHGVYGTRTEDTDYAIAVYNVPTSTPRVPVYSADEKAWNGVSLRDTLAAGVPMPDPTLLPDGKLAPAGTDGSVIVKCGNEQWEFWILEPRRAEDPQGFPWRCQQAGYMANVTTHPGAWQSPPDWGISAAGVSYWAGVLTGEDWNADTIRHPLFFATPLQYAWSNWGATGDVGFVNPASRSDGHNFTNTPAQQAAPYRLKQGMRFRLPATFDVTGYAATVAKTSNGLTGSDFPTLVKILTACRDYGIVNVDSAGGIIGFSAEGSKVYGTPYHPYATAPTWGNFGQQLPWESFAQVAVPATPIAQLGP